MKKRLFISFFILTCCFLNLASEGAVKSNTDKNTLKAQVDYTESLYDKNGGYYGLDLIKASKKTADMYYGLKNQEYGNLEKAYWYYFVAMTGAKNELSKKPSKENTLLAANCAIEANKVEAEIFNNGKNKDFNRYITSGTIENIVNQMQAQNLNSTPVMVKLASALISTYIMEGNYQKIPPVINAVKNMVTPSMNNNLKIAVEDFFENTYKTCLNIKDYNNAIIAAQEYKQAEVILANYNIDVIKQSKKLKNIYDMLAETYLLQGNTIESCQYAKKSYNVTYYLYPNDLDIRRFEPFFSVAGICKNDQNTSAKYYAYKAYKNGLNNSSNYNIKEQTQEAKRLYEN